MDENKASSVCRLFYEKFPSGKRVHKELVSFLLSHHSSRAKLEEWILSADAQQFQECVKDDPVPVTSSSQPSQSVQCNHGDPNLNEHLNGSMGADASLKNVSKCDVKSMKERELGNENFKKKRLGKSLCHYNEAIKYARFPEDKNGFLIDNDRSCLSLGFANRSAIYDELGVSFYDKALKDIDFALKYGYPEKLRKKLLIRKASIFVKQGKCQAAEECLAIIKVSQADCGNNTMSTTGDSTEDKIKSIEMQIKKLQTGSKAQKIDSSSKEEDEKFTENINFESASANICIRISSALGRHVTALTDLKEGDVLFKELPFASVLLSEFYESHCHHCHKPLHGQVGEAYFFPCSRCTQVLFCDNLCAESAEVYHVHECGWLNLLHSVGIAHLAIRMVLTAGVDAVLDSARNHSSLSDLTNLEIFKQGINNYKRVYSLVDHLEDMFEEDLFQYTLTASLLTRFLITKTEFLNNLPEETQLQIGGVILRHICQLVCNAHAITDILPDEAASSLVVDEYQKRIATAIFPCASIMNHSCDSNILFYFVDGKQLMVKGARTIKKGANVFNCYGPHFRRMSLPERQEVLMQQYFFQCNCDRCKEELKTGISFADQFQALKCEECEDPIYLAKVSSVKCLNCGQIQNMSIKIELLTTLCDLQSKGEYLLKDGRISEATQVFQSCFASASKILFKYNSQYGKLCDSLARCLVLTGNRDEAKTFLEKSLKYVEVRFGRTSIEFQKEWQKYLEVCENGDT